MAEETMPHRLNLENREKLTMTGVTEIISFDEGSVLLKTSLGTLTVLGEGLQLKTLTVEGGNVAVDGKIHALEYQQQPVSWLHRLLG